jgi:hypothetical protein
LFRNVRHLVKNFPVRERLPSSHCLSVYIWLIGGAIFHSSKPIDCATAGGNSTPTQMADLIEFEV